MKITAKKNDTLLKYLVEDNTGYSRSKLKSLLKNDCISVNGNITSQFDYPISENDCINIESFNKKAGLTFDIVYEDNNIIVIDKPQGILSVPFNVEDKNTAYDLVKEYLLRVNPKANLYIVHRLDQGTSGVLMFAKDEKTQKLYQDNWNNLAKKRVYIAYVEGVVKKDKDTIISNLNTDKGSNVYSSRSGKKAITHYRVLERGKNDSLLEVTIDTGRQNQIRVHLKEMGHPIVGDKKYGSKINPIRRLGLHASSLVIQNPITKEIQNFKAKTPKSFKIVKGKK